MTISRPSPAYMAAASASGYPAPPLDSASVASGSAPPPPPYTGAPVASLSTSPPNYSLFDKRRPSTKAVRAPEPRDIEAGELPPRTQQQSAQAHLAAVPQVTANNAAAQLSNNVAARPRARNPKDAQLAVAGTLSLVLFFILGIYCWINYW